MAGLLKNVLWYGAIAGFMLFLSVGCENDHRRRQRYVKTHPDLSISKKKDVLSGNLIIGMTMSEVKASYGRPGTVKDNGKNAVWTYSTAWGASQKGILRFYKGKLVEIQVDNDAY